MRAVTITKPGGPEVLTVTDHPVRAAAAGEVRIAVKAAAVNPTDILMRENPAVYAKGSPGIPGDGCSRRHRVGRRRCRAIEGG
jgi:NADPH2:quinone reductase